MKKHWILMIVSVALSVLPFQNSFGQFDDIIAPFYLEDSDGHMAQIQVTLNERTTLKLTAENTFEDLFKILKEEHDIQAVFDPRVATDLSINRTSNIVAEPFELEDVPLRRLLCFVLRQHDLVYVIDDGFLLITSADDTQQRMKTRIYDVADLISPPCFKWVPAFGPCFGGLQWIHHLEWKEHADFSEIMDLIESTIAVEAWSSNGGEGEMMEFYNGLCLVVLQTDEVHEQLEQLFEQLRKQVTRHKSKVIHPSSIRPKQKEKQTCGQNDVDASKGSGLF